MIEIVRIPALSDNYIWLAHDPASGETVVVDPAEAGPVLAALDRLGWRLTHILNTHHHGDHVGGNRELKDRTGCTIVGHARDAARIPGIDVRVGDGDTVSLGNASARVIAIDGHTVGHIAYWFADAAALFCGDTLFSLGCGRLFEGTAAQMWTSLGRLRDLPAETRIYCGHESTEANARFALSLDPDNPALRARAADVRELRARAQPTVPSVLGDERACNPFLRCADPAVRTSAERHAGRPLADAAQVFGALRAWKDGFRG